MNEPLVSGEGRGSLMSHDRDRPKKPQRKPKSKDKKRKGVPPHLQRRQEQGSIHEIQRYLDDLAQRQHPEHK